MGVKDSFTPSKSCQDRICSELDSAIGQSGESNGDFWIKVSGEKLLKTVEVLQVHSEFLFDSFVDLCGVDYLEEQPRFEVVIHLYSSKHKHRIRIRCMVPDTTLTIPSLTEFWPAANWQEREAFDMYGIRFHGHPNLERILSPPDTEVFAQRKDYPLKGERESG